MVRKFLLICGIASSLLYVGTDIFAAMRWEGYNVRSQAVSELIAIDAPTRPLVVPLFITYSLLVFAFGAGVWRSAGQRRALRIAGAMLIAKEVEGLVGTLFTPMHLRGVEATRTDALHGILAIVGVLFILLAIGFAANAFGRRFRRYSIATLLVLLVCGVAAGANGPRIAAQLPTPWLGVAERITIGGYLLWVAVLAITLLRADDRAGVVGVSPAAAL